MLTCILAHAGEGGGFGFPPLHPIFVNFTAGLIPAALLFDLLGAWLKKDSLRSAGWWTLLLAACLTPVTVVLGWFWMKSMEDMEGWEMPYHKWLGISLGICLILFTIWRGVLYRRGRGPGWAYGIVGVVVLGALAVQGDLGGAMSFGRGVVVETLVKHHDDAEETHDQDAAGHEATKPATSATAHDHSAG
jgi:uncharacterized membrane protein